MSSLIPSQRSKDKIPWIKRPLFKKRISVRRPLTLKEFHFKSRTIRDRNRGISSMSVITSPSGSLFARLDISFFVCCFAIKRLLRKEGYRERKTRLLL